MRIVAQLFQLPNGHTVPSLTAIDENGDVCEAVKVTLLDFVSELPLNDTLFEELLSRAESGSYKPHVLALADWSENDKLIWVRQAEVPLVHLRISNENIPDYSVDGGSPQCFSTATFRSARAHWRAFIRLLNEQGYEHWLGKRLEIEIP